MRRPQFELPKWLHRLPVVCVGLGAFWLLSGIVIELGFASRAAEAEDRVAAAVRYAIENPVVEIPARLLPAVRAVMPAFESNEMFAFLREAGGGGATPQAEFDGLVAEAYASVEAHPRRQLGVVPARLAPHTFLTHQFVHAGVLHLLATLLLWLLAAPQLEKLWGRRVFAGFLAFTGMVAGAIFALAHASTDRALVGASALVSACVVAVVVRFRAEEIDFLGWLDGIVDVELSAPAWVLGGLWLAYEGSLWWAVQGSQPPGFETAVGYTAHAVGAVLGGLAALAITRLDWERRFGAPPAAAPRSAAARRFDFQKVVDLRARGEADRAFELLEKEVGRSARNRDVVSTFWEMCIERGEPERGASGMKQLVREELRRGALEIAAALWRETSEHLPRVRLQPSVLLGLVSEIRRLDGDESALIAVQQILDQDDATLAWQGLARTAQLAEDLSSQLAASAGRRALALGGLPEGPRLELEQLLARCAPAPEAGAPEAGHPESGGSDETAQVQTRKPDPPPNVFFDEADRSAFGDVDDLSALDERFPDGAVTEARPRGADADGVRLRSEGQGDQCVAWSRVRGVAVAGVKGLGPRPVVVIDLLIDGAGSERPLCVMRLRSDQFSPRQFFPKAVDPVAALRSLVQVFLKRSSGRPLPDASAAELDPPRVFESLEAYHEQVLRPAAVGWA